VKIRRGDKKPEGRRSVYGDRPGPEEEHWHRIGEIDPLTGQVRIDPARIGGWTLLAEFLWRRQR
jgi:hypothetical protein